MRDLLTVSNPKIAKSTAYGWHSTILHLAPSKASGFDVCRFATSGCVAACLTKSGHAEMSADLAAKIGGIDVTAVARVNRTRLFFKDREAFVARFDRELAR